MISKEQQLTGQYIVDCRDLDHLKEKVRNIASVYFSEHCREKPFWRPWFIDRITDKIQSLDGRFYWDNRRRSVNFEEETMIFPFGLDEHRTEPGYFAFVATCFPETTIRGGLNRTGSQNLFSKRKMVDCAIKDPAVIYRGSSDR